jgi:hypothetical protein
MGPVERTAVASGEPVETWDLVALRLARFTQETYRNNET